MNWSRVADNTGWAYAAALIVTVTTVASLVLWVRDGKPPMQRYVLAPLSVGWLAGVTVITLSPVAGGGQAVKWSPGLQSLDLFEVANFLGNALLFVPGGMLLYAVLRRPFGSLVAGLLLSLIVEVLQYFLHTGRRSDVNDVIANAMGVAVGVWTLVLVARVSRGRRSHTRESVTAA